MFSGTTGCPSIAGTPYKGGGDCFTLAQKMKRPGGSAMAV